jgi:hypothetical protein
MFRFCVKVALVIDVVAALSLLASVRFLLR